MKYKTIYNMDFKDKRVLVRIGADVPVDKEGNILDDSRLKLSIPTISKILSHDPKRIIIITHIGRPKNNEESLKTNKLTERLKILLTEENIFETVSKVDGWQIPEDNNSKIVVMENLRFNPSEKAKDENERNEFAKSLANQADLFVQDAFSNAHREHASMTGIPKYLPGCVGSVVEMELRMINNAILVPKHPLTSIIGGLKADKLAAIKHLLQKADKIIIGGALAFTILKTKGYHVGKSIIDSEGLDNMGDILEIVNNSDKIVLPVDCAVAKSFNANEDRIIKDISDIADDEMALDIGPKTIDMYKSILSDSKTIIWNGPIGVFEFPNFRVGTEEIANHIANLDATSVIGGGDSANAIHILGLSDKITHVSSGGGASLELFEGRTLVAIDVLKE